MYKESCGIPWAANHTHVLRQNSGQNSPILLYCPWSVSSKLISATKSKSNVSSSKFGITNDYYSEFMRLKQTMRRKRALTCIFSCCRRAAFCISNCLIKLTIFPFNSLIAESFSLQSTSLPRNWHLQKSDEGVQ